MITSNISTLYPRIEKASIPNSKPVVPAPSPGIPTPYVPKSHYSGVYSNEYIGKKFYGNVGNAKETPISEEVYEAIQSGFAEITDGSPESFVAYNKDRINLIEQYNLDHPKSDFANADDPNEVNSLLDVFFMKDDSERNTGENIVNAGIGALTNRPNVDFVGIAKNYYKLIKLDLIDPIRKKNAMALLYNNVHNFGESIDIFSNAVKAALPVGTDLAKEHPEWVLADRLKAVYGLREDNERYSVNMDFDGFFPMVSDEHSGAVEFAAELVAECLVDPLTVLEVGLTKATTKIGLKAIADEMPDVMSKALINNLVDVPKASKYLSRSLVYGDENKFVDDFVQFMIKNKTAFGKATEDEKLLAKEALKRFDELAIDDLKVIGHQLYSKIQKAVTLKVNWNVYRGLCNSLKTAEALDKGILKFAASPFFYPAIKGIKEGSKHIHPLRFINKNIARNMSKYGVKEMPGAGLNFANTDAFYNDLRDYDDAIKFGFKVNSTYNPEEVVYKSLKYQTDMVITTYTRHPEKLNDVIIGMTDGVCNSVDEYISMVEKACDKHSWKRMLIDERLYELKKLSEISKIREENLAFAQRAEALYEDVENFAKNLAQGRAYNVEEINDLEKWIGEIAEDVKALDAGAYKFFSSPVRKDLKVLITKASSMLEKNERVFEKLDDIKNLSFGYDDSLSLDDNIEKMIVEFESKPHSEAAYDRFYAYIDSMETVDGFARNYLEYVGFEGDILEELANDISRGLTPKQTSLFTDIKDKLISANENAVKEYGKINSEIRDIIDGMLTALSGIKNPVEVESILSGATKFSTDDIASMSHAKKVIKKLMETNFFVEKPYANALNVDEVQELETELGYINRQLEELYSQINSSTSYAVAGERKTVVSAKDLEEYNKRVKEATEQIKRLRASGKASEKRIANIKAKYGVGEAISDTSIQKAETGGYGITNKLDSGRGFETNKPGKVVDEDIEAKIKEFNRRKDELENALKIKKFQLGNEDAVIQIRCERFFQAMSMLNDAKINKLREFISSDEFQNLKSLIETNEKYSDLHTELVNLDDWFNSMQAFETAQFYTSAIINDDEIWMRFMQAIQSYSQRDLGVFDEYGVKKHVIDSMELSKSTSNMIRASRLDAFRANNINDREFKKLCEIGGNVGISPDDVRRALEVGHDDPGADTIVTVLKMLKEEPETFERFNKYSFCVFDIETAKQIDNAQMTTNKFTGQVTQMGMTTWNPITKKFQTMTYRVNGLELEPVNGKCMTFDNELSMLEAFDNGIAKNARIIGFNSSVYDVPYLRTRYDVLGLKDGGYSGSELAKKSPNHFDLREIVDNKNGVRRLNEKEIDNVYKALDVYVNTMYTFGQRCVQSFNISGLRATIRDISRTLASEESFAANEFSGLTMQLREMLTGIMKDVANETVGLSKNYSEVYFRDIYNIDFKEDVIRQSTSLFGKDATYDDVINIITAESGLDKDVVIEAVTKAADNWTDPIQERINIIMRELTMRNALGDELYSEALGKKEELTSFRQLLEGQETFSPFNYKRVWSGKQVEKYFDISLVDDINTSLFSKLMKKSKQIDYIVESRIKDLSKIDLSQYGVDWRAEYEAFLVDPKAKEFVKLIRNPHDITDDVKFAFWYSIRFDGMLWDDSFVEGLTREEFYEEVFSSASLQALGIERKISDIEDQLDYETDMFDKLIRKSGWESYTPDERAAEVVGAIESLRNAGAREFAIKRMMSNTANIVNLWDALPSSVRAAAIREEYEYQAEILNKYIRDLMKDALRDPRVLLSHMLYDGKPYLELKTGFGRYTGTALEVKNAIKDFVKSVDEKKEKELAEIGIKVVRTRDGGLMLTPNFELWKRDNEGVWNFYNGEYLKRNDLLASDLGSPRRAGDIDVARKILNSFDDVRDFCTAHGYKGFGKNYTASSYAKFIEARGSSLGLPSPEYLAQQGFWRGSRMNVGAFRPVSIHDTSFNPIKDLLNFQQTVVRNMSEEDLYAACFFDHRSFDEGEMFMGLNDDQIVDFFVKHPEIGCGVLKETRNPFTKEQLASLPSKYSNARGVMVEIIPIKTKADVAFAREVGATVLPYQVISNAAESLKRPYGELESKWKKVVGLYKLGYLMKPGAWFVNTVDSIAKVAIDTGFHPVEFTKEAKASLKELSNYQKVIRRVELAYGKNPSDTAIKKYFADPYTDKFGFDVDNFLWINGYQKNGPSAGEWFNVTDINSKIEHNKEVAHKNAFRSIADLGLAPMGWVEGLCRYTQFKMLLNRGFTRTESFAKVEHTAFNYNVKSEVAGMAENLIPFFNYFKLNLFYWIDTLSTNPQAAKFIARYLEGSMDNYDYNPATMRLNNSKLYHMLAGNIAVNSIGTVLRVNPSALDALKMISEGAVGGHPLFESMLAPALNYYKYFKEARTNSDNYQAIIDGNYVVNWGRYKGYELDEIPEGYLQRISEFPEVTNYILENDKPLYDYMATNGFVPFADGGADVKQIEGYLASKVTSTPEQMLQGLQATFGDSSSYPILGSIASEFQIAETNKQRISQTGMSDAFTKMAEKFPGIFRQIKEYEDYKRYSAYLCGKTTYYYSGTFNWRGRRYDYIRSNANYYSPSRRGLLQSKTAYSQIRNKLNLYKQARLRPQSYRI